MLEAGKPAHARVVRCLDAFLCARSPPCTPPCIPTIHPRRSHPPLTSLVHTVVHGARSRRSFTALGVQV